MFMLLIEMSLWVISAFLLSLAPLLTKSYKGCKCICANGVNSSKKMSSDSDSDLDTDSTTSLGIEKSSKMNGLSWWQKKLKWKSSFSISGIHKYCYNELKAATHNFTTSIGQGNASNFYKAKMPNGESLAIKVLATNVTQGKREFQAEVQLLARLHHRNLVNLVGYCIEKRRYMLVYAYMNNGSLATHLYSFSMFMLLIEMSLWVISAFLLSLAPLLTKSYKGCKCICANGVNSSKKMSSDSDSDLDTDSTTSLGIEKSSKMNGLSWWQKKLKWKSSFSISGIHKYRYNELKAATHNFTTSIGQGNASNFYKAKMPNGESLAIKVLTTNVRQGKREFQAEVQLLARLHHRNLVNLVGYCIEKRQYMLVYAYMNNGSLATHLYSGKHEVLNWNVRFNIALDVSSCLEYLHHGTFPPVVHRDIKSSNILLDSSMRARVTGFGVSRKEMLRPHSYKVKCSFGYVDPEYILTRIYTTKSDVFSFGVLLFELIAGRTPKAGLLEYVELAVINTEGNSGWEELVDSRLEGEYYIQQLNGMAALAYRCIDSSPINRSSMKDIVQELSQIRNFPNNRAMLEEVPISKYAQNIQNPVAEDGREEADDTSPVLLRCFSV